MRRVPVGGRTAPNTALVASLSLGAAMVGSPALPQEIAPNATPTIPVPEVAVSGVAPANQLQVPTGVSRLPSTVQDTPQTINVVPQEILQQQNATTLEQALRNVPGITSTIGEGGGGVSGDQFRIRGFAAQNDINVDGLRDYGSYTRDAFTFEDVQVLKGAAGFAFGSSSVGGAININSKTPTLENRYLGTITGGMGPYIRGTLDLNQRINETMAVRLNVMGQSSNLVDRQSQTTDRWGVAPSVAFGLGTPTTLTVEYLHYHDRHTIDGGTPVITPFGRVGRPAPEFGLDRSLFFGVKNDIDDVTVDRITARLSHRFANWLTVTNDFRATWVDRVTALTPLSCSSTNGPSTANPYAGSCSDLFLRGINPVVNPGGPGPYSQQSFGIQNVTTAVARFNTGPLRHELVGGVDIFHENVDRTGYPYLPARPSFQLRNPYTQDTLLSLGAANNQRSTDATSLGLFLNERLWLLPTLSIYGGFRWTDYDLDYKAGTPGQALTTNVSLGRNFWDPRTGAIWEPTPSQTYYFSYSTSSTPPGTFFTTIPSQATANSTAFEPERNTNYEVGAKISLFEQRLGLTGALFRSEKSNALAEDASSPGTFIQTGDRQRVQGIEIGATGRITPEWNILASYTHLNSETTSSTTAVNVGKRVQFVPENAASLWTTYDIAREMPYNATVGLGVTWRGQVYLNQANTAEAPSNFSLDALVQHRINQNLTLRVNGYNLTNRTNYEGLFANRVVVAAGRTVLFSVAAEF
ncbi:TonB-dependent receptor [Roseomonas populi]|uniref:TonB-dependent siderophore receptor n=1 Tax=Roseomonas populi TaxID=3121582 RepID=A0ABT1XB62_9PROT|nr:TonB-dependent siderophore receptor [Roseomonas pecuniae]MCR0985365.1 TonB-dependent siderophore receptor [Roseomonas pecuniae]